MRRQSSGFLMMELVTAIAVFCGAAMMVFVVLKRTGEVTAVDVDRTNAASRLERTLEEVRKGIVEVRDNAVTELPLSREESLLRGATCRVRVEPWTADTTLRKVTVTIAWRLRVGGKRSLSASTLVRTSRLRLVEVER